MEFNDRRVFTKLTKDMGLMSVVPRRDGSAIVRHEASGQSQIHASYEDAVKKVKGDPK